MSTLAVPLGLVHARFMRPSANPPEPRPTAAEIQGGDVDHRARLLIAALAVACVLVSAFAARA